jgi:hypothetical protein
MAILAAAGVDAQVFTGDIKKAFRNQFVRVKDLQLFVYMVSASEFYVDLRHPFGHITSEFCFHSITAVIQWAFGFMGVSTPSSQAKNFVDNWFLVAPSSDATFDQRAKQLELTLTDLGVEVHEQQLGPKFNALGWDWDTSTMRFTCPAEKRLHFANQSAKWAADATRSNSLSTKRAEKIVGSLNFLALAAPCLRLAVGHLKLLRRKALNRRARSITLTMVALNAVKWLAAFLQSWPGSGAFSIPFSPRDSWQALLRQDASSEVGFGAMAFPLSVGVYGVWSAEERRTALAPDDPQHQDLAASSSTVLELTATKHSLSLLGPSLRGMRVQLELDSLTSVIDLRSWSAGRPAILTLVNEIWDLLIEFNITPRFEHILRDYNKVADFLSNSLCSQAKEQFELEFGTPLRIGLASPDRKSFR